MHQKISLVTKGMHCASCEVLIEKKLLEMTGIKSVEAKAGNGEVLIEYTGEKPDIKRLNEIFKKENYVFSEHPPKNEEASAERSNGSLVIIFISALLIFSFLLINRSGLSCHNNIN